MRILVIDDDSGVRAITRIALRKEGHEVVCAASGAEGIALAKQGDFDLVITDIDMPLMDGIEVARSLRENGYNGAIQMRSSEPWKFQERIDPVVEAGLATFREKPCKTGQTFGLRT